MSVHWYESLSLKTLGIEESERDTTSLFVILSEANCQTYKWRKIKKRD
jgi:hypothetical protein